MKNKNKYLGLLIAPFFCLALLSCNKNNYDPNPSEADLAWVKNVKLVIGGAEIAGKINENKKEILFPKMPANTDLSNVSFKGDFPPGASFEKNSYNFTPEEGDASTKMSVKVVNNKRFREYYVTLNLSVPPSGINYSKGTLYNFSAGNGGTRYPDFNDVTQGRVADIDQNYVLIVNRVGAVVPHLLRLEDLKKGIISNPIPLNLTGVTGGTYTVNAGRLINGHVYICNLTTGFATSSFKVYHWDAANPDTPPTTVANYLEVDCAGVAAGVRYGDYFSMDVDDKGNGYIFSRAGSSHASTLRIKVENFTQSSEPTILSITESAGTPSNGAWGTCNMVDGNPGEFIFTSSNNVVRLINVDGGTMYNMTTFAVNDGGSARTVNFNNARYLITLNSMIGSGVISLYDITKGSSTTEALTLFDGGDALSKAPLYQFSLGGTIPSGNVSCGVTFAKDNDKLYVLGSGAVAGFAFIEFPIATETDPFDDFVED
ncbi:MAG: DUF4623 domain-containing protein [Prevotellaceae bacterium]|jgi:hypothetical protein|nr:DUF4623 domain-containing protein [Prevotellaceae bacterium]